MAMVSLQMRLDSVSMASPPLLLALLGLLVGELVVFEVLPGVVPLSHWLAS